MNKWTFTLLISAFTLCSTGVLQAQALDDVQGSSGHVTPHSQQWVQSTAVQDYLDARGIAAENIFRNDLIRAQRQISCFLPADDVLMAYVADVHQVVLDMTGYTGTYDITWMDPVDGGLLMSGSVPTAEGGQMVDIGLPPPTTSVRGWVVIVDQGRGIPQIINLDIIPAGCQTANLTTQLYNNGQIVQIEIQRSFNGVEFHTLHEVAPSANLGLLREMWKVETVSQWQAFRILIHWQNGVIESRVVGYAMPCSPAELQYGQPTQEKKVMDRDPEGN